MSKVKKRKYTWKPDLPDHRDYLYVAPVGITLPTHVDLRPNCSPIEDQGNLGSCTANSLVGALEYLENKSGQVFVDLSRLFIYYNERVLENSVNTDSGAMIRDGVKTLNTLGVCPESEWPYQITKFKNKPTTVCYKDALTHKISVYQRITTLNDMKSCLASGNPFVFGFTVYTSFESAAVAKTGIVPMPAKSEKVLGGHAVCAVGYDDAKQWFIVRNSWGTSWGDKGYFYIPYAYVTNTNLADDIWTITK